MEAPPSLRVLSRSDRPATSNLCLFHVDEHSIFCAHAVDGGTVILQEVRRAVDRGCWLCGFDGWQKVQWHV